MSILPIEPRPPVGSWLTCWRGYIRSHGVRLDPRVASLTEAHVGWYVSALLLDPSLDDRSREAVRRIFFGAGVATLVPSDPPQRSSEAIAAVGAPRVALWKFDEEEPEDEATIEPPPHHLRKRRTARPR